MEWLPCSGTVCSRLWKQRRIGISSQSVVLLGSREAELTQIKDGVQLVSTIVRKDTAQLLSWVDPADGKSGLDKALNVVSKLVEQDEEESGGLGIGDLLVSLYRRAGDAVNNNTALLQSLVRRLKFAKTATFAQVGANEYHVVHPY
jgi:hypothetical protein